jgi:putative transposase
LVFTSRDYTALVRSYGLRQEFITPHCPQQNGMVERVIRTLQRAMRASPPVRDAATCQPRDRRLDPVLQPSTVAPGTEDEDPG